MSIPDYRIFFRRCAAFFLAGVLAAGSASAQQAEPPSAAPEQAEEAKQEQPQTQPNQSEMDAVIMALCHEITILKKNEEKRMAVREVLVKNADATYNYFDTRVFTPWTIKKSLRWLFTARPPPGWWKCITPKNRTSRNRRNG